MYSFKYNDVSYLCYMDTNSGQNSAQNARKHGDGECIQYFDKCDARNNV